MARSTSPVARRKGRRVPSRAFRPYRTGYAREWHRRPECRSTCGRVRLGARKGRGVSAVPRDVGIFSSRRPCDVKALMEGSDPSSPGHASVMAGLLHAGRDSLSAELADSMGCRPFVDTPNIAAWKLEETPDAVVQSLDIWHRSIGTLGIAERTPAAPPAMIAGVLAHTAERLAMGEGLPSKPIRGPSAVSVGALFDLAHAQNVRVRVVFGELPDDLKLEPEHVLAIRAEVAAGKIVVVPERAIEAGGRPRQGWWRIEPGTGATIDQLENGGGAAQVEYKGATIPVSRAERIFSCTFFFLPAVYYALAYALSAFDFPAGAVGLHFYPVRKSCVFGVDSSWH